MVLNAIPPIDWRWARFDALSLQDLYDVLQLRARVFILEQGPYLDPDGLDQHGWHLLGRLAVAAAALSAGELVAGLRLIDPGSKYAQPSLGRVAVDARLRGCGLGRALVAEGLRHADQVFAGQDNRISAQAHLARFYAGFGFAPHGPQYLEDGIPHIAMLRRGAAASGTLPVLDVDVKDGCRWTAYCCKSPPN